MNYDYNVNLKNRSTNDIRNINLLTFFDNVDADPYTVNIDKKSVFSFQANGCQEMARIKMRQWCIANGFDYETSDGIILEWD